MSEAQHTPGPWEVNTLAGPGPWEVFAGNHLVADAGGQGAYPVPPDQAGANARLIAAAPDLLAALREATQTLHEAAKIVPPKVADAFNTAVFEWTAVITKAVGQRY